MSCSCSICLKRANSLSKDYPKFVQNKTPYVKFPTYIIVLVPTGLTCASTEL